MADLTSSQANNITSPDGNSLAVFVDGNDSQLKLKDVRGSVQPFCNYIPTPTSGASPFEYGSGTSSIQPKLGSND